MDDEEFAPFPIVNAILFAVGLWAGIGLIAWLIIGG